MNPDTLILAGPTAVGKSSLALEVAKVVGGSIISADSRQVYRGMNVGTATASAGDRATVPHYGLDLLDPDVRVSAGALYSVIVSAITDSLSLGHPAVVVAGSTLYVDALVSGLSDVPNVSRALEAELTDQARRPGGAEDLYRELREADPEAAATLDPTKTQRLIRFVGVLRETGVGPSHHWRRRTLPPIPHRLVVLDRPREELYERIEARVDKMISDGLVDEARALASQGLAVRRTLEKTIGYRELLPVFSGKRSVSEAIELIKRNTRRYAKRQLTWYRRYPGALWLDAGSTSATDLLQAVAPWPHGES